jgi:hypothetical protein
MKLHREARLCAVIFAGAALSLGPRFAGAQTEGSPQSLDGLWLSDGYGDFLEFQGDSLRGYEITTLSCIASNTASRKTAPGPANEIVFATADDMFRIFPGASADTRWLHEDWSVSNVMLRRSSSRPEPCQRALPDTPITNYQVFWETFSEQYPFFALRQMDWPAVDKKFRPQVTPEAKPGELFRILSGMIDPLHDAHTSINAKSIQKQFHGFRPSADPMQKKNAARITEIIETKYVRSGLRDFCNKQLQFGLLHSPHDATPRDSGGSGRTDVIGYLRIHSFSGYSNDHEFLKQLDSLEAALDDIFNDSRKLAGLVIDVRINGGGSDVFGISIASRLATEDYLAYSKVVRNDIHDPDHRTPPQPVVVHVSERPGFRGRVVLLTSADSVSAAETFTMALLDRHPHVVRVGSNTQGVFSDVLGRKLPNGWTFGLPNEVYLTKDGKAFDGTGVPPDIHLPVFPWEDLSNGRDSALDKALELLAPGPN